jgi:uncharacterized protein YceK
MRSSYLVFLAIVSAIAFSGCGTTANVVGAGGGPPRPYGGALLDACMTYVGVTNALGTCEEHSELKGPIFILLGWAALVDFPMSVLGDTATLPFILASDAFSSAKGWFNPSQTPPEPDCSTPAATTPAASSPTNFKN